MNPRNWKIIGLLLVSVVVLGACNVVRGSVDYYGSPRISSSSSGSGNINSLGEK